MSFYLFILFVFYLSISEIPSFYVAQAGLEQLDSSHCSVSTTGVVCTAHLALFTVGVFEIVFHVTYPGLKFTMYRGQ